LNIEEGRMATTIGKEMQAITTALEALEPLDEKQRQFAVNMIATRLNVAVASAPGSGGPVPARLPGGAPAGTPAPAPQIPATPGTRDNMAAKKFLAAKNPESDIQRVSCLAYYLAKYEGTHAFKTPDLDALNKAAAGGVFPNIKKASDNAIAAGFLAPAGEGRRQLAQKGEAVVDALPDQAAARTAAKAQKVRQRKRNKKAKAAKAKT
jgi:hypothetical protein